MAGHIVQKRVFDGPSRHPYGTFGYDNILFLCINIGLLVAHGRVAFFCSHETGSHLDAIGSQLHGMFHILTGIDPSCHYHRNMLPVLIPILLHHPHDLLDLLVVSSLVIGFGDIFRIGAIVL